jgi:hypothetical protein
MPRKRKKLPGRTAGRASAESKRTKALISPQHVRAIASDLTGQTLAGIVEVVAASGYGIPLSHTATARLLSRPVDCVCFLACIPQENGWIVSLIGENKKPKAYWTDMDDPTNQQACYLATLVLRGRIEVGAAQPRKLMYDHEADIRRTYIDTDAGEIIVHSRRLNADPPRTEYVVEVKERPLYLRCYWEKGRLLYDNIDELAHVPF